MFPADIGLQRRSAVSTDIVSAWRLTTTKWPGSWRWAGRGSAVEREAYLNQLPNSLLKTTSRVRGLAMRSSRQGDGDIVKATWSCEHAVLLRRGRSKDGRRKKCTATFSKCQICVCMEHQQATSLPNYHQRTNTSAPPFFLTTTFANPDVHPVHHFPFNLCESTPSPPLGSRHQKTPRLGC